MSKDLFTVLKERRTFYGLNKEMVISDEKIQEIVKDAIKYTPSAFNSQSARAVVLLGASHDKLWDITKETLRKIVPADSFASTEDKMNTFRSAYGTVLFFEDNKVIEKLQSDFALYKDNFPIWSLESSGMAQLVVWMALEAEGLGASLQHYNPLIDNEVKKEWNIPESWKLIAQMPFGKPTAAPGEKQFNFSEEHFKIVK